jgi:hypothetical protein
VPRAYAWSRQPAENATSKHLARCERPPRRFCRSGGEGVPPQGVSRTAPSERALPGLPGSKTFGLCSATPSGDGSAPPRERVAGEGSGRTLVGSRREEVARPPSMAPVWPLRR